MKKEVKKIALILAAATLVLSAGCAPTTDLTEEAISNLAALFDSAEGVYLQYIPSDYTGAPQDAPEELKYNVQSAPSSALFEDRLNDYTFESASQEARTGSRIYLWDGSERGYIFLYGSDIVIWFDEAGEKYLKAESIYPDSPSLCEIIFDEFADCEMSAGNIAIPASVEKGPKEIAALFVEVWSERLLNLVPENRYGLSDFILNSLEVTLEDENAGSVFVFRFTYSVKPEHEEVWSAGNGEAGSGDLEGYMVDKYYEMRLEILDGYWRCAKIGTGDVPLYDEEIVRNPFYFWPPSAALY